MICLVVWRVILIFQGTSTRKFPNRPVRIVVPYLAGGGTDSFARIIKNSINQSGSFPVPVVIENRDGGSATIGSRFVKNSKPDGYRILCHHEGIIATHLAGVVPYGPEAFRPIAQTGQIVLLMVVRADSPYQSLPDLLKAAQEKPNQIRMGANLGSPAYFICKQMLAEYPGAEFNFVSASGSKRIIYILGGKIEAGIFSLAEFLAFRKARTTPASENIAAIANFGEKRNPAISDVKTSREQGLQTSAENAYYFWAPLETPDEVVEQLATVLERAMNSPATLQELEKHALEPVFRKGADLERHLAKRIAAFDQLATETTGSVLPDFAGWAIGLTVAALLSIFLFDRSSEQAVEKKSERAGRKLQVGCLLLISLLVTTLQLGVPFWITAPVFFFVIAYSIRMSEKDLGSGKLPEAEKSRWHRHEPLVLFSILLPLAIELVFKQLFSVPLP